MAKDNLEERLRTHVSRLAGDIGERNVFRPLALEAASSYLERQWREQGYAIGTLAYEVSSIRCANLEVTRRGGVRKGEILLIGAPSPSSTRSRRSSVQCSREAWSMQQRRDDGKMTSG